MPVHDWTRVDAGIFHAFHMQWIAELSRVMNRGLLPPGYYALPEQVTGDFGPDVLTLRKPEAPVGTSGEGGTVLLTAALPRVRLHMRSDARQYVAKSVVIRHVSRHQIIAIVEIVSPGNKSSRSAMNAFVRKAQHALASGIHLSVFDLFPPGPRDPQGIHRAIWGDDCGEDYAPPGDQPLTCVSYVGGARAEAFVEFVAPGQVLPDMALFLTADEYIPLPLEQTYRSAWEAMPDYWREVLTARPQ